MSLTAAEKKALEEIQARKAVRPTPQSQPPAETIDENDLPEGYDPTNVFVPPAATPVDAMTASETAQMMAALNDVSKAVGEATGTRPKPETLPVLAPETSQTTESKFCPNCGFGVDQDPVQITDEDKRLFLKALLGRQPFVKTFELFGDSVKVTFRSRNNGIDSLIAAQLQQEIKDGRLLMTDINVARSNYAYRQRQLQLAAAVVRVTPGMDFDLPPLDGQDILKAYTPGAEDNIVSVIQREIFKGWPDVLYGAVYRQYALFEQINLRLMDNANRPDFWKGIGGLT